MTASMNTLREPVDVAVGVLVERDEAGREARVLMTSRPDGKVYAGYWEFPGGKLEVGETVAAALHRELQEELGITIGEPVPWQEELVDYPHARVRLHFCKIFDWQGDFDMREGQQMSWQPVPVTVWPVLPGALSVLARFAQDRGLAQSLAPAWMSEVRFGADGLVPVIAQERASGDVLMFAHMNRDALARTALLGEAVYFSRSRQRLWHKGEASGHVQKVHEIRLDCDGDVVLLQVDQLGHDPSIACHTGRHACFFRRLDGSAWHTTEPVLKDPAQIYG